MFDAIAPTYDLLNTVLSFGVDGWWRRRLVRSLGPIDGREILDVACGTGDLLILLARRRPARLVGLDLAPEMLRRAEQRMTHAGVSAVLVTGAAEELPFVDRSFDIVTAAFGIRNFEELSRGLSEMRRVLRPGGSLRILEFSRTGRGTWGWLFRWYFMFVLPSIGRWVSGHNEAYRYLPDSVETFPDAETLSSLLRTAGFSGVRSTPMSGGIATLTIAE